LDFCSISSVSIFPYADSISGICCQYFELFVFVFISKHARCVSLQMFCLSAHVF
jgi:hypothetical protein